MVPSLLEQFLVTELFAFILIFCRMGAGIMVMPGIGEAYISPRIRLHLALAISLILVPVFGDLMPEIPGSPLTLLVYIVAEIIVGLFIGYMARMLISTMHVAGTIIATQSSLAMATIFDTTQASQSTVVGNFLTMSAVVFFFAADMHHIMLNGLADSYSLFPPGMFPVVGDMAEHYMLLFSRVFLMAIKLAAPHIVFALLFYVCSGVLSRLMPSMHVFFILMPAQLLIAFFLILAIFSSVLIYYTGFVEDELRAFLNHDL